MPCLGLPPRAALRRGWRGLLTAGFMAWASLCQAQATEPQLLEQGRRIYQEGLLGNGQPLQARGAGGTVLQGQEAACVQCHRRSGMGSREGSLAVPAIAGPLLFAEPPPAAPRRQAAHAQPVQRLRQDSRQAYDDASLARALREGLDSSARTLEPLMPRYALQGADLQALGIYLHQLSAAVPPGLQGGVLHLATIISPDADPARAARLGAVLQAWARSAPLGGMAMELQVWQLHGPAQTWQQQLQDYQRQQPVYAVLSGLGRAQWSPVRDFCEASALPCLFAQTDLAPTAPGDFYTVYFSRGVPLEAQMLARHLQDLAQEQSAGQAPRLVQVYSDAAGQAAASLLAQERAELPGSLRAWSASTPGSVLADVQARDCVVLWLRPPELAELVQAMPKGPAGAQLLLSAQLADPQALPWPTAWRERARWVSARSDPQRLYGKSVLGLQPWAAHLGLPQDDSALLAELYAATYYFADALARMRGSWNQAYLMETLENANFSRPAGAAFFTLSLAPGQREAAKGGHLLGFAEPDYRALLPMGARITP